MIFIIEDSMSKALFIFGLWEEERGRKRQKKVREGELGEGSQ